MTGVGEIRAAADLLAITSTDCLEALSAEEVLRVLRAIRLCDWDLCPDQLTASEIAKAARGYPKRTAMLINARMEAEQAKHYDVDNNDNVVSSWNDK